MKASDAPYRLVGKLTVYLVLPSLLLAPAASIICGRIRW